jgi:membrane-associated phospholipid phosphatase
MKDRPKHELEPLRAIDPRVAVEGGAVAPQPGDLAVTALVGGERRAEERDAEQHGERPGEGDGGRWGPPRTAIDGRTAALAGTVFGIALLAQVLTFGLSLTPDRYLLVLLAPALVLGRGRRFLLDFVPFVVLIVVYEECRGIAHTLHPHPFYAPQLDAEKALFLGHVPSVELQDWLWTGSLHWYDEFLSAMTRVHFIVPPTLAFGLWLKRRALFYRFAATLLVLSYAGALTFALFPAAPPWAAAERGLIPFLANPAGVQAATSPLPTDSGPIYRLVDGNPYAAVPSLHGGYSLLIFLFLASLAWRTRWRWWVVVPAAAYPIIQSVAVVYTGNHYVVDLLIGFAYAVAAFAGVRRFWRWQGWPE